MILIIDDKRESVQGILDFLDENKSKNKKYEYVYRDKFEEGQQYFEKYFAVNCVKSRYYFHSCSR